MLDSKSEQETPDESNYTIIKDIWSLWVTILITLIAFFMVEVITTAFTGHLGDSAIIAGAGLGSM